MPRHGLPTTESSAQATFPAERDTPFSLRGVSGPVPTQTTLRALQALIGFRTESSASNLDLISWCREQLASHGVRCRLTYDSTGTKANLFATLGDNDLPGLVLSGHTDVVPVQGQLWETDPYTAVLRDDRIHGRGTADMKGYIAVCMAMVPHILAANLRRPVHLALTFDEETTMDGVRLLLADLRASGQPLPHGCIVGEPTGMRPVVGHKGRAHWRCTLRGKSAHASLAPQGVNAIEYAARLIEFIRQQGVQLKQSEAPDTSYDIPSSTVQTGMIRGGSSANTVPAWCEFDVDMRNLPGTDVDEFAAVVRGYAQSQLLPEMLRHHPEALVAFEPVGILPPYCFGRAITQNPIADLLTSLAASDAHPARYVSYGTEAGWFQGEGIPTLIMGPGYIAQAHKPDEYVTLSQLERCEAMITRLIDDLGRLDHR